jgi:type I restriction enzyme R subunit
MAKTIIFCNDIDHADRMRRALINHNPEQVKKNDKYVIKITGDDEIGKGQLDNFINPKKPYPVIATTSELMTTGVDAKTCKLVVLDQNIQSMTKFKQIIGRGTRIDDNYNKLWFTILDFKKATELFADPAFDGEPEQVLVRSEEQINDLENDNFDHDINNEENQSDASADAGDPDSIILDGAIDRGDDDRSYTKYYVSGVAVHKVAERVQYYGNNGKLVTESFKDYTRKAVLAQFASLDDFVKRWSDADRKQAIIDELANAGVIWEALEQDVGNEMEPFDLICHVVFDQPALTRKERAENVKKRNYFSKYSESAQVVLNALLDKYANNGITEIESHNVLKVTPFDKMGRPREIITKAFGGKSQYDQAISDLEHAIYADDQKSA